MQSNVPFNGSLRLVNHGRSNGMYQAESVFDTVKMLKSIMLGEAPIEWVNGEPDQNDHCDSSICSTPFLQSIQSGLNDASFPPEPMQQFSLIPENMSLTSTMYTDTCDFINLYTEISVRSKYAGILTSLQVIKLNVYILVGFLFALEVYIYLVREKSLSWSCKGTVRDLIDGQFGFIILVVCYFSVFYVSKLLTSSFTTNYSIKSRDEPLVYLDDLNKSTNQVTTLDISYCHLKMAENPLSSRRIHTIEPEKTPGYIYDHLFSDRIVFFESGNINKACIGIFCSLMINIEKISNFYVHAGDQNYFSTFRTMVYHNFIEKNKKMFLQRATYSCMEMGFCIYAFDRAVPASIDKNFKFFKNNAQCNRYEQVKSYPMVYHPIAFITFQDLLYLFIGLFIFSSFVLIIELIRSCNQVYQ